MSGNGCGSDRDESSPGLAIHNEPVISGADAGGNLTVFLGQAGWHAGGYKLGNHHSNKHSNLITDSLPSGGAESHRQTSTGKSVNLSCH